MAHGDDDRSKESAVVTVASPRESWREQQRKSPDSLPVSTLMNNSPKRTPSLRRRLVGTRGRPASPSPPLPSHSQHRRHRRHGAKHNPNDVRRRQTLLAALVITACRLARPSRSRHHPSPSRTRLGPIRTLNKPRLHGGRPPRLRHRRHLYSASESAFQSPPPPFFSSQKKTWNPKKERPHISVPPRRPLLPDHPPPPRTIPQKLLPTRLRVPRGRRRTRPPHARVHRRNHHLRDRAARARRVDIAVVLESLVGRVAS